MKWWLIFNFCMLDPKLPLKIDGELFHKDDRVYHQNGAMVKKLRPSFYKEKFDFLDTLINLPDTSGGITGPYRVCFNHPYGKAYIGAYYRIAVFDMNQLKNKKCLRFSNYIYGYQYDSIRNKLYVGKEGGYIDIFDGINENFLRTISIGGYGAFLEFNPQLSHMYAANYLNKVFVINTLNDSIIREINVGSYPRLLFYVPSLNKLYCASSNQLYIISVPSYNVIAVLPSVSYPQFFEFNPNYNKIYLVDWDTTLMIIDGIGDTIIKTLTIPEWPTGIAYSSSLNRLYISSLPTYLITVVDGANDQVITYINLSTWPMSLIYDGDRKYLYVPLVTNEVAIIDCNTNNIITRIYSGELPQAGKRDVVNDYVYILNTGASNIPGFTVSLFRGLNLLSQPVIGFSPFIMLTVGNKIYASSQGEQHSISYNTISNSRKVIKCKRWTRDLFYHPNTNRIFVAQTLDGSIGVINPDNDSLINVINTGPGPFEIEWNSTNEKLYVPNEYSTTVTVINPVTQSVITNVQVGNNPFSPVWAPDLNKVYVTLFGENKVAVIDGNTNQLIRTISVGEWPYDITYNIFEKKVYVANYAGKSITVINALNDQVIKTISLGDPYSYYHPHSIAYSPVENKVYCGTIFGPDPYNYGKLVVIRCVNDSVIDSIFPNGHIQSVIYDSINNLIHVGFVSGNWKDGLLIIKCENDSMIFYKEFNTNILAVGLGDSKKKMTLTQNGKVLYYANYFNSQFSVVDLSQFEIKEKDLYFSKRVVYNKNIFINTFPKFESVIIRDMSGRKIKMPKSSGIYLISQDNGFFKKKILLLK